MSGCFLASTGKRETSKETFSKGISSKRISSGSKSWMLQRITAVGLLFLTLWFLYFCMVLIGDHPQNMRLRFQNPFHASCWILFLSFSFYHGWLGAREIIKDYVHSCWLNVLMGLSFFCSLLFFYLLGLLAILKLLIG